MALFFVDEDVLYKRSECIVCPIKMAQLFLNKEMCGKIASICGAKELYNEFVKAKINGPSKAGFCSGLNIAEYMIQIVITPFDPDFELSLFNSYLDVIKVIIEKRLKSVIIPYLPYSYKRLGNMYSYKSCITLLSYFLKKYRLDCTIYVLVEKQVMADHLDGYVSTYESTSYPLSKRHTPRKYPLINNAKLEYFLQFHDVKVYNHLIDEKDFKLYVKGKFKCIYELIIKEYDDATFCYLANIDKKRYKEIFTGKILPSKYEALSMALVLNLSLKNIIKMLEAINEEIIDCPLDNIILSYVGQKYIDIFSINERLYMLGLVQLGSYKEVDEY